MVWLMTIISFIPQLKRFLMKKFGSSMGPIVLIGRIVFVVLCFIILVNSPSKFENTFKGEDGTEITLKEGRVTIKTGDTEIQGTYQWESKDNDYYIHVKGDNVGDNLEYRYRSNEDGGSLCLLENNECTTIYLPVN